MVISITADELDLIRPHMKPKGEYSLSGDGHEFREAILPLLRWAASREDGIREPCVPGCKRHKAM